MPEFRWHDHSRFREINDIHIPCVIRNLALYRKAVLRHMFLILSQNDPVIGILIVRPYLITVRCFV